jgi:hypothetical protein
MPDLQRSSWIWIDFTRSAAICVALLVQHRSTLLRPTISRTAIRRPAPRPRRGGCSRTGRRARRRGGTAREADVDDVLVLRQHRRVAQARGLHDRVAPHLDRRSCVTAPSRAPGTGRAAPLEAGVHRVAELAEGGDHGLLAFLHDEEAAAEPDQQRHDGDQAGADAGALHVGLEAGRRRRRRRAPRRAGRRRPCRRTGHSSLRLKSRQSSSRSGGPSLRLLKISTRRRHGARAPGRTAAAPARAAAAAALAGGKE